MDELGGDKVLVVVAVACPGVAGKAEAVIAAVGVVRSYASMIARAIDVVLCVDTYKFPAAQISAFKRLQVWVTVYGSTHFADFYVV